MTTTTLRVPDCLLSELHAYHPGVFVFAEKGFPFPLLRDEAEAAVTLVNEVSNDPRFSIDARDQAMIFLRKALNNMETIFGESDSEDEEEDGDGASFLSQEEEDEAEKESETKDGAGGERESKDGWDMERISTLEREVEDLRERVDELEDYRQRMNDLSDSLAHIAAIPLIPSMTPPASQAPDQALEPSSESPDTSRESADTMPSYEKHSPDAPDTPDALTGPGTPDAPVASDTEERPVSVLLPRQVSRGFPSVSKRGGSRSSSDSGMSKVMKVRPRRRNQEPDTHLSIGTQRSLLSHNSRLSRRSQLQQLSHRSKVSSTSSANIGSLIAQPPSRSLSSRALTEQFLARLNAHHDRGPVRVFESRSPSPVSASSRRNQLSIRSKMLARTKLDLATARSQLDSLRGTTGEREHESTGESTRGREIPAAAVSFPPGSIPENRCTSWECEHNPPASAAASAPTSTRQRVLSWKARWTREKGDMRWARPESPPGSHSRDKRTRALVAKLERLARY